MKIQEVIDFKKFYDEYGAAKLPIKTAYRLNKIWNTISVDYNFYEKNYLEIIKNCALKDENGEMVLEGQNVVIQKEKQEECVTAVNELINLDVENEPTVKLSLEEDLPAEMTPNELNKIMGFIE